MPRLEDWIALTLLPGLGSIQLHRALARFADPAEIAYRIPVEALAGLCRGRNKKVGEIPEVRRGLRRRAEKMFRLCEKHRIRAIPFVDDAFPAALREIPDPPVLVYQQGELPEGILRVAVIGSRTPTRYGRRIGTGLATGLAARGIEVVSGGARGIDGCAHRGALEGGGRTVCVLGSGLLEPYPVENRALFEKIAEQGTLISEFPIDERPFPANFLKRNRLISGLSAAVVVVEATCRSGSQNTASHALEQGREVMAVPGQVGSERSQGCHALIQQGAKLVQNIEDILNELPPIFTAGIPRGLPAEPAPDLDNLTTDEAVLIKLLDPVEPVHLDELADRTLFGIPRLQGTLFGLEIRGALEQCPGGYYLLRPRKGS